jgi:hypothetical protein
MRIFCQISCRSFSFSPNLAQIVFFRYHKGILLAAITGTKYTQVINEKGGWNVYGQNMDEIWIFYNSLVCQTMVRWGAYKSGCYVQAKRLMSPKHGKDKKQEFDIYRVYKKNWNLGDFSCFFDPKFFSKILKMTHI